MPDLTRKHNYMSLNALKLIIVTLFIPMIFTSQNIQNTKRALLIIDIQEFYFKEGNSQLVNPEEASKNAAKLLAAFRESNQLVVHIRHAATKDSSIHENVKPTENEKVIIKKYVNSYRETDLLDYLKKNEITEVVICGMMTHMCVEAAARASADFGFNVLVIDDACATRNLQFGDNTVEAADVHTSALATINGYYGKVISVDEFLSE